MNNWNYKSIKIFFSGIILLQILLLVSSCKKDNIENPEKIVNDSVLVDFREPLLGTFNFITYKYGYSFEDDDDITPARTYYDTIIFTGTIDTFGRNKVLIKYWEVTNSRVCIEGSDTSYMGYGLATPIIDSTDIMIMFDTCKRSYPFEGSFVTLDSLKFHIGIDGLGGGYHERVFGTRN